MAVDSRLFAGLSAFAAVLEAGSFVRAGEVLGLTQSAVSRSVQRLEERLGVRLFERTSKVIRLTEDGERFCAEALPLFSQLGEVAEGMVRASGKARGRLRINVEPSFARLFLAPRIGTFLKTYPDVRLEILVRERLGDLVAEGIDAAILFGEPVPSALIARRLLHVHILIAPRRITWRDVGVHESRVTLRRKSTSVFSFAIRPQASLSLGSFIGERSGSVST